MRIVPELTEALNAVTNDQVLITHGTDTMPETARYLVEHADLGDKVVVLTGAMQPAVMARSDAGSTWVRYCRPEPAGAGRVHQHERSYFPC